jgi:hypothetical protein
MEVGDIGDAGAVGLDELERFLGAAFRCPHKGGVLSCEADVPYTLSANAAGLLEPGTSSKGANRLLRRRSQFPPTAPASTRPQIPTSRSSVPMPIAALQRLSSLRPHRNDGLRPLPPSAILPLKSLSPPCSRGSRCVVIYQCIHLTEAFVLKQQPAPS